MKINKKKRLIIIAGGTGGHIFPALTVAKFLVKNGWKIKWIGTSSNIESELVPKYGFDINFINVIGFCNKILKEKINSLLHILPALFKLTNLIFAWKPTVVLGMGNYISFPVILASWFCGIPIILHEQNSILGLTNKLLTKIANKTLKTFPNIISNKKMKIIGNPIRSNILKIPIPEKRFNNRNGPIRILILGGSNGSLIFNKIMPIVANKLGSNFVFWHQTGKKFQDVVYSNYLINGKTNNKITEFIEDISIAYNWADLVICRSGALTVTEIAIVGLPALFVPFKHTDNQQYYNALFLKKIGAAKIINQQDFSVNKIFNILSNFNRKIFLKMAKLAKTLPVIDTTKIVAKEIISISM